MNTLQPASDWLRPHRLPAAGRARPRAPHQLEAMPEGAHPRDYSLLTALMSTGPISQQRLAEQMRVNRTLVVGIVDELERRGWVERRRDADDRRSYRAARHARRRGARPPTWRREVGARQRRDGRAPDRRRARAAARAAARADHRRPGAADPARASTDLTGFLIVQAHFMARDRANEAFRDLPDRGPPLRRCSSRSTSSARRRSRRSPTAWR